MATRSLSSHLGLPIVSSFGGAQSLWWPCSSAPRIFLLYIPGNPGLASYYTTFLSTIYHHPSLSGQIEVLAISHRGHASSSCLPQHKGFWQNTSSTNYHPKKENTSLSDQIRHKITAIDAIRKMYPTTTTKLILSGHSVGSYIAIEVLKQRSNQIDGLYLLFPTLSWISKTPNGSKLKALFKPIVYDWILMIPLFLISLVPILLLRQFLGLVTNQSNQAIQTTMDFLTTKGAVRNSLRMASEEMETIKQLQPDTIDAIRTFTQQRPREGGEGGGGGVVRSYWSKGEIDGWVPSHIRKQIEIDLNLHRVDTSLQGPLSNEYRATSTVCQLGIPHAFCLDHSELMALIVTRWLEQDLL